MKDSEKYTRQKVTEEESDRYLAKLIRAKFFQEQKAAWAEKLERDQNLKRTPGAKLLAIRKIIRWTIAAAAVLLIGVLLFPALNGSGDPMQQLVDNELDMPFPNYLVRKGAEDIDAFRLQAAEAYNAGDFQQSAALNLRLLEQSGNPQTEDYFFLGLSRLYSGRPAEAVVDLQAAQQLARAQGRFEQEVDWYLALAQLQAGDWPAAEQQLREIVLNKQWKQAQAGILLRTISESGQ